MKIIDTHSGWFKEAQLSNYLVQLGYSQQFIQYVSTLPKHVQKAIGNEINSNGPIPEPQFMPMIQQFLSQPPPAPGPVQKNQPRTPVLDARFANPQAKEEFFKTIPKEYVPWVIGQLNNQRTQFIPDEDSPRLIGALKAFTELKGRADIPIEKDINKYQNLLELENVVERYSGTGSKSGGYLQYNPMKLPGVELIATLKNGEQLYKVSDVGSVEKMGLGTKWCTRGDYGSRSMAERYIQEYKHLFIMVKDGKPYMQMTPDLYQIMDVKDNPMPLPKELYKMFGPQYAKQIGVTPQVLQLFEQEGADKNEELLLKTVAKSPNAIRLASPELKMNPQFAIRAIQNGVDSSEFEDLLNDKHIGDDFTNVVERLQGNYDYRNLSYRDLSDDLENIIFGKDNFGVEVSLSSWDYTEAYDEVLEELSGRSGGYNNDGGGETHYCAKVLARAAIESDMWKIKEGDFKQDKIMYIALGLAQSHRKVSKMNYERSNNAYVNPLIEPFLEPARKEIEESLKYYGNTGMVRPDDFEQRVRKRAFEKMQEERKYPNLKSLDELDPAVKRNYICEAIDKTSRISQVYDRRQKNDEDFYFEDDWMEYPDEPDPDDFESDDDYRKAYDEWETAKDSQREEAETEHRNNNLPWCLDDAVIEEMARLLETTYKSSMKLPSWMVKMFGSQKSGSRPQLIWSLEHLIRKAKKPKATVKTKKPKRKVKANGWYSVAGNLSEEELEKKRKSDFTKQYLETEIECVGYHHGQTDMMVRAYDTYTNQYVGYLSYSIFNDEIHVSMIEVLPNYRRQGVGTLLIKKMKEENPKEKLVPGLFTSDGYPFFKAMKRRRVV